MTITGRRAIAPTTAMSPRERRAERPDAKVWRWSAVSVRHAGLARWRRSDRIGSRPRATATPRGGPGRRWLLFVAPAVIGVALATAACGGSPQAGVANLSTTTNTTIAGAAGPGHSSPGGSLVEYATCMRSHGVSNFPDPASLGSSGGIRATKGRMVRISAGEASSPNFQAAQRACAKYYGQTALPQRVSPLEMQKLLAVSRCMRAHGVPNFPDPNPTTGELSPAGIDKSSPQVLAALRACSSLGRAAGLGPPNTGG
jgi:hypothetical protein